MQTARQSPPVITNGLRHTGQPTTTYPEGGWQAWTVVFGAWCAMMPSMGLLNTVAVLHAWVAENELPDVLESSLGWVFSSYAFFLYFCGAQVGPVFDTYDVHFLTIPGSIGIAASLLFVSLSSEYYQFLLSFGILGGISASLLFTPSISAIGHWFSDRRALATGIACTAGSLGGVLFPLVLVYTEPHIGFAWAIRILALISASLGLIGCRLLQKRLPPNKQAGAAIDLRALSDTKYGLTTLAIFLIEFAVFIPYTYICSHAIHVGLGHQKAYILNVWLSVGGIPGRAFSGYIADRVGTFNTMCATAASCTVLIFGLWYSVGASEARLTAFAVLFGFLSGAAIALTPVCVGQVCDIEDYGKRNGTTFFVSSFGALVGVPIAGAILPVGGYEGLVLFAGSMYIAAFLAFLLARVVAGGWVVAAF